MAGRLAYVLGEFPSLTETFILRELEGLRRAGIPPCLFALRPPAPGQPVHPGASAWATACTYPRQPFRYVRRAVALAWRAFPARSGRGLANVRVFARRVRSTCAGLEFAATAGNAGIGHVHAHFLSTPAEAGLIFAHCTAASFSLSAHAWDIYTPPAAQQAPLLKAAQRTFVCSAHGLHFLCQRFPGLADRSCVLAYHGLPLAEFTPAEPETGHIVALGRCEEKKGFADLLEALALVRQRGVRFHCTLAGGGALGPRLRAQCAQLGLDTHVTFPGTLDLAAVRSLLARAALFVMPSVVATNGDRDGLPTVVLEAMACAVPVISTTANATTEIIQSGENGWLVPPGNPQRLAETIAGLLTDAEARRGSGQAGRATIEQKFRLDQAVQPLVSFFRQCTALT